MAKYTYRCTRCTQTAEVVKPMAMSDTAEWCGLCEQPMQRTYTAPGVVFKGTGFASTEARPR